jgi:phenylalanyl-tRNA synthetase alpha chain
MTLQDKINNIKSQFADAVKGLSLTKKEVSDIKNQFLGRKGSVAQLFNEMKNLPPEDRSQAGKELNILKSELSTKIDNLLHAAADDSTSSLESSIDPTLPGDFIPVGSIHPIEKTIQEIKNIFGAIGFNSVYGPEIDDDYHNFEALNIPHYHPARDMQDTFYITDDVVLRTHTSNTQIHVMEEQQPPLRVIVPGRVYRNEAISVRSYCLFHQIEGLYVSKNVTFAEMKGTLEYFVKSFFGQNVKTRFRPSYFPFTEPSAEVDVSCIFCKGSGCKTCKQTGWLEILGCGMVDPDVFLKVGYDPEKWSGYAFGLGIERMTMLKYGIDDIRLFFNGDVRFLRQFR